MILQFSVNLALTLEILKFPNFQTAFALILAAFVTVFAEVFRIGTNKFKLIVCVKTLRQLKV